MHPRGHELVHIRSMNWVQSTFITCQAFLFFARTSLDILGPMTVSSTSSHSFFLFQFSHPTAPNLLWRFWREGWSKPYKIEQVQILESELFWAQFSKAVIHALPLSGGGPIAPGDAPSLGGARCGARPLARMTKGSMACREQEIDKVRGQAAPMLPPRVGELRLRASAFSNRGRASASERATVERVAYARAQTRVRC